MLPHIGISVGDLAGIGPEVIYKTFLDPRLLKFCTPVVYGTATVLFDDFPTDPNHEPLTFRQVREAADIAPGKHNAVSCWDDDDVQLTPGQPSPASGAAARQSLLAAARDLKAGLLDALVTAPISKENTQADDFRFPGHTEFLTTFFEAKESLMLLVADDLRVATVTGHIPLKDVATRLTKELLTAKLRILLNSLKNDFGIEKPRVAVLGLNPHAGENGLLGTEEASIVTPVLQQFQQQGHLTYGPYPADGYFGTGQFKQFDATLSALPRPGPDSLQNPGLRTGRELHGRPVGGAHLPRPRHRLRPRRPVQSRRNVLPRSPLPGLRTGALPQVGSRNQAPDSRPRPARWTPGVAVNEQMGE